MDRSEHIIKVSMIGILVNALLAIFKAVVGFLSGSIAIVMDALNNLSDAMSSLITIIGTKLAKKPADHAHPFGYGRVEYFSALIIAVIVLSTGVSSLIESVKNIINPTHPVYTTATLIIIIVAIVAKLLLGTYVKNQGQKLESDALIASGVDALFDAAITLSTLISAFVMLLFDVSLDGALGTLISLVIIKAGVEMVASPLNELLGARIAPDLVKEIKQEVLQFTEVKGIFDIILHNYGSELMIGSFHISVDDSLSAREIHGLTRKITDKILANHKIIATVGIYALGSGNNKWTNLQNQVTKLLSTHSEIIQFHGFYYFEDENKLSIDVVPDLSVHDDVSYAQSLENELKQSLNGQEVSVVIDHNYT